MPAPELPPWAVHRFARPCPQRYALRIMKRWWIRPRFIGVSMLVLLLLIVTLQNTAVITVHILFWSLAMSTIVLPLFAVLVGLVVGYAVARGRRQPKEYIRTATPKEGNT